MPLAVVVIKLLVDRVSVPVYVFSELKCLKDFPFSLHNLSEVIPDVMLALH